MSQETSYAAVVRKEAALSASVPWLVNAALCQYVGGHLQEGCLGCVLFHAGCVLGSLQKLPSQFSEPYVPCT